MMAQKIFNVLSELISFQADRYYKEQITKTPISVIGNLYKSIESNGFFRDAQFQAIKTYIYLKEVYRNTKVTSIIQDKRLYENIDFLGPEILLKTVENYAGIYLHRYFQNEGVKLEDLNDLIYDKDKSIELLETLLQEHDYTNYMLSLPMGAGKTYLIAALIYIDAYLYDQTRKKEIYANNALVLIPSGKKNSISSSLVTIKHFDPSWLFGEDEGQVYRKKFRIELLDEQDTRTDKNRNSNPNLAKIKRTVVGHSKYNVFIINAEKIDGFRPEAIDVEDLAVAMQTKIGKAEDIRTAFSSLKHLNVYVDEAHHIYDNPEDETKLRQAISDINDEGHLVSCICMSGTPYLKNQRSVMVRNKKCEIDNIQDVVYYYSLAKAVGNYLKVPKIDEISDRKIITEGLDCFFENYNFTYYNGTVSKVAIYCIDSNHLNDVKNECESWCRKNSMNPDDTILIYYSDGVKDADKLPKENKYHFDNLDNPTSTYRIILLIGIGTEGWDCKCLTGVILPRAKSGKIFVLQSSCRCLREVYKANTESAYICLSKKNKETLQKELYANYRMTITDLEGKNSEIKQGKRYPVTVLNKPYRVLNYHNIKSRLVSSVSNNIDDNFQEFSIAKFQEQNKYDITETESTITEQGLESNEKKIKESICDISFIDFCYNIVNASYGYVSYGKVSNNSIIREYYDAFTEKYTWFDRHPNVKINDVLYNKIARLFLPSKTYMFKDFSEDAHTTLLKWNIENPYLYVTKDEENNIVPYIKWDAIDDSDDENNKDLINRAYLKIRGENKEKMFNYYPLKTDGSYEIHLINCMLNEKNISDPSFELYYNGYNGSGFHLNNGLMELEKFQILTDAGVYTPDFLLVKNNTLTNEVEKVLIIETKGEPYNTEEFLHKESFVKKHFLTDITNGRKFDYIKISDVTNYEELDTLINKIQEFFEKCDI